MPTTCGKIDERYVRAVFILVIFPSSGSCEDFCSEPLGSAGEEGDVHLSDVWGR